MNSRISNAGARAPGPIGLNPSPFDESSSPFSLQTSGLVRDSMRGRSPECQLAKGLQMLGPYPRMTVTEGHVSGIPGERAFTRTSRGLEIETYRGFATGHTHSDVYLAPYLPEGQRSYEMSLPAHLEKSNFGGRMHYLIPAGSEVFASTIPLKKGGYDTSHYRAEIDQIKKAHPNAVLFVHVHTHKEPRVEVLGFDPDNASIARTPRVGREVVHMYSNSAYTSLQRGTLAPVSDLPSDYAGTRFGDVSEISHRNELTYVKAVAARLEALVGQELGLKIFAWKATKSEIMIPPTTPSQVTNGYEVGFSGASPFYYIDNMRNVTAHTIPLKANEPFSADHPALARHIAEHPAALHMCRLHTDFALSGKPQRIEVVSVE